MTKVITPTQFLNQQIEATQKADFLSPYDKHLLIAFYDSRKKKRLLEIEIIDATIVNA
ncbi:hypothetical protein [Kordia sp.]|uniref:hypothetical protein n=1 Tax=Kordia sp. TaxID=1965332 RepID=UPI0025B9D246|nr:hypothetical protein [Kordia sp.]MCH2195372.1 hypothetical protein [Kordia sp.]